MRSLLPDMTVPLGKVLGRAAVIFVPVAAALTAAILLGAHIDGKIRLDMTELREKSRVELAAEQIGENFGEIGADLRLIANLPSLKHYLNSGSPVWKDDLAHLFLQFAREKHRYGQIRYLDTRGREVIRVNFNNGAAAIVPSGELQDKSSRYYFREAIKLKGNEIYVSPLDLNIEHGQLEIPYKPMIRFATPVFDSAGRKKGVLVFNYLGDELIRKFREIMRGGGRHAMLLNSDGYWLAHPDLSHEWGFMRGKDYRTFRNEFPLEWPAISGRENGHLLTEHGLFVFETVYPLLSNQHLLSSSQVPGARSYRWKLVSFIPAGVLSADSIFKQTGTEVLFGGLYLTLGLGSWVLALVTLSRRQTQLELANSHARYDELTRSIPVGVYQFRFRADGSYSFEYVSPVFCQILGVHAALVLADAGSAFSAAHPDDAESLTKSNRESANTLRPFRWEGRFIVRGETRWLRIAADATQHGDWGSLWSGVVTDVTERKELERELEHQAHIDMLTGLSNRRHFFELAEKELSRARRHHEPLAMLMLDVDYFKQVNDTYGHDVGDTVLRKMGEICTGVLRNNDILGRLGGEEFAILLPETAMEQALETAERLRHAVADSGVQTRDGKGLHLTVSLGVASLESQDGNVDAILKRADEALYAAKNAGRNRVCAA